jgi:hypothetical protein
MSNIVVQDSNFDTSTDVPLHGESFRVDLEDKSVPFRAKAG